MKGSSKSWKQNAKPDFKAFALRMRNAPASISSREAEGMRELAAQKLRRLKPRESGESGALSFEDLAPLAFVLSFFLGLLAAFLEIVAQHRASASVCLMLALALPAAAICGPEPGWKQRRTIRTLKFIISGVEPCTSAPGAANAFEARDLRFNRAGAELRERVLASDEPMRVFHWDAVRRMGRKETEKRLANQDAARLARRPVPFRPRSQ